LKIYNRYLQIGANTLITSQHHFDVVGSFVIGNHSWIAGCGSQFWTHGAGAHERNISIGERCYIGSAVRFALGSSVGNNNIVGLGSVVTTKLNTENAIIAGQPSKIVKENYDWKTQRDI
jgi:acetyltransferase-like isoleucine patch superfamily enzyme